MKGTTTQGSNKPPETMESLLIQYEQKLKDNREMETRLQATRIEHNALRDDADKSDDHLRIIQNTGQLIGEILKQIDNEKCKN